MTQEELRQKIEELDKKRDALRDEENSLSEEIRKLELEQLNMPWEGKYIKYVDTFDSSPTYMKVKWIRESKEQTDRKHPYAYTFAGLGFYGEFTGADDDTEFYWSYWFEFTIKGNYAEVKKKIDKIVEIDKEEFDEAFDEMLNSLKEYHHND